MKIFAMNDCDWMAGEDMESVTALYLKEYAGDTPADEALDDPQELTEAQLDKLRFQNEEAETPDDYQTFRQRLRFMETRGDAFPAFFATAEY